MSDDFLSQEEIDALLGGSSSSSSEEKPKEEESPIKPFDFSQLEHIKKGGIPGLELIFERWVAIFRDEVRKLVPQVNMISKEDIYITRFNSFMLKIPLPASYTILSMKPLKENSLLVLDSRLVFTLISVLFGGPAKPFKVEGREFTKIELKVLKDLIDKIITTFQKVWEPIYPLNIEMKSIELNPNLARIVSPNEKVIVVELSMDIDGYIAPFFFCFPQSMFVPIKEIIYSEIASLEKDPIWEQTLQDKVLTTDVNVWLELCRKEFKTRDILNWEIGTEIVFEVEKDDLLKLYVQDKPKFLAKLGKKKGKYAAMVKKLIKREEENGE